MLKKPLGTPNRAGKSYPKATSLPQGQINCFYGRSSLPFASLSTLQVLQKPLGTPNRAGKS